MLFKAPPENVLEWDLRGIQGQFRWIQRLWHLTQSYVSSEKQQVSSEESSGIISAVHETIEQVTKSMEIETHSFNVAIASLMKLSNAMAEVPSPKRGSIEFYQALRTLTLLLAPMAPHLASEMWFILLKEGPTISNDWIGSHEGSLFEQSWPTYHPELVEAKKLTTVAIMVLEMECN